jgi:hypothetical protein
MTVGGMRFEMILILRTQNPLLEQLWPFLYY